MKKRRNAVKSTQRTAECWERCTLPVAVEGTGVVIDRNRNSGCTNYNMIRPRGNDFTYLRSRMSPAPAERLCAYYLGSKKT